VIIYLNSRLCNFQTMSHAFPVYLTGGLVFFPMISEVIMNGLSRKNFTSLSQTPIPLNIPETIIRGSPPPSFKLLRPLLLWPFLPFPTRFFFFPKRENQLLSIPPPHGRRPQAPSSFTVFTVNFGIRRSTFSGFLYWVLFNPYFLLRILLPYWF